MARKIKCNKYSCKHHEGDDKCNVCVTIGGGGGCETFEKGFAYYFHIVWDALGSKNFIDFVEVNKNPDLKTGMYYVMECYHLGFEVREWGTCRFIVLKNGKDGEALKYEDIKEIEIDMEKFGKHYKNFTNGIIPEDAAKENDDKEQQKTEVKEFGWLSPTGEFTESPFGTHEESAKEICNNKNFNEEYREWRRTQKDGKLSKLKRDFLSEVKGYCLIHNPSGYCDGYIITNQKNLTKKQKDFLYGYFIDMGDRFKAEQFIEEGK